MFLQSTSYSGPLGRKHQRMAVLWYCRCLKCQVLLFALQNAYHLAKLWSCDWLHCPTRVSAEKMPSDSDCLSLWLRWLWVSSFFALYLPKRTADHKTAPEVLWQLWGFQSEWSSILQMIMEGPYQNPFPDPELYFLYVLPHWIFRIITRKERVSLYEVLFSLVASFRLNLLP